MPTEADGGAAENRCGGDWAVALDRFEAGLATYEQILAGDEVATPPLWPPPDLIGVPIPADQVERARAALAAARSLEGRIAAKQQELPIGRTAGPSRRVTPSPSFLAEL
jgi:hypothetical protein